MSAINEITTIIKLDIAPESMRSLRDAKDGVSSLTAAVSTLSGSGRKNLSSLDNAIKTISGSFEAMASAAIKGTGIAGEAIMEMLSGGVQKASALKRFADTLGLSAEEISIWAAAVDNAGGSAEAFLADLVALQPDEGALSFDDLLDLANELHAKGSLAAAIKAGKERQISDSTAAFLHQGGDEVLRQVENARKLGHGMKQRHIDDLSKTRDSYAIFKNTAEGAQNRMVGELNGPMTKLFDGSVALFAEHSKRIGELVALIARGIEPVLDGMMGNLDEPENRISRFNERPAEENRNSDDPAIRMRQVWEDGYDFLAKVIGAVTMRFASAMPGMSSRPSESWDKITKIPDDVEKAGAAFNRSIQADQRATYGEDYPQDKSWFSSRLSSWLSSWVAPLSNKVPWDSLALLHYPYMPAVKHETGDKAVNQGTGGNGATITNYNTFNIFGEGGAKQIAEEVARRLDGLTGHPDGYGRAVTP